MGNIGSALISTAADFEVKRLWLVNLYLVMYYFICKLGVVSELYISLEHGTGIDGFLHLHGFKKYLYLFIIFNS